jgi:hypothetical protein
VLKVIVLVNTLSAVDVATLKFLWEHAFADSGFTELALETNLVLSKVIPRTPWKGIYSRLWFFGPSTCSEVSRRVNPSNRFCGKCGKLFGRSSG